MLIAVYEMNSRWERSNRHPPRPPANNATSDRVQPAGLEIKPFTPRSLETGRGGEEQSAGLEEGEGGIMGFVYEIIFGFALFSPSFPISYSYFSVP